MPLGIERINARRRPPNERITFIKALDGPDNAIAQDFLERIAAIVYPIMRDNHLSVMSLDEYPPTMEFWGRNFNAGECIQLVLKNPKTRLWLPFTFVQGVMIHELAHIKQMNHSYEFWALRKKYAMELNHLHAKAYTGEGFWSAGRTLLSSEYTIDRPIAETDMPKSICGGTYRSRGTRRRRRGQASGDVPKKRLTYAERQQRIKERKFGPGDGNKVGADKDQRISLENGRISKGPPKIANSNRGRELRAAAALKRFEQQKIEEKRKEDEETEDEEDWTEEYEEDDRKAVDVGGGQRMVPVSKEEDVELDKEEMGKEMLELLGGCGTGQYGRHVGIGDDRKRDVGISTRNRKDQARSKEIIDLISSDDETADGEPKLTISARSNEPPLPKAEVKNENIPPAANTFATQQSLLVKTSSFPAITPQQPQEISCPACSSLNSLDSVLCEICANVLEPGKMPAAWRCNSVACRYGTGRYYNSGDAGVCGVCGQRKGTGKT